MIWVYRLVPAIVLTGFFTSFLWAQPGNQAQADRAERLSAQVAELVAKGDLETAVRYQQEVVTIYQARRGREDIDTLRQRQYLGVLQTNIGDLAAAQQNLEQCLNIRRRLLGEDHTETGNAHLDLGVLAMKREDFDTGKQHFRKALAIYRAQLGESHESTILAIRNYAILFTTEGNYEKGAEFERYALQLRKNKWGDDHPDTAQSLFYLGYIYNLQGEAAIAREHFQGALAIYQKQLDPQNEDTLQTLINLAQIEEDLGNVAQALEYHTQVYTIRLNEYGAESIDVGLSFYELASFYHRQVNEAAARDHYNRAVAIYQKQLGPDHEETLDVLNNLAAMEQEMGHFAEAHKIFTQVYSIRKEAHGSEDVGVGESLYNLGSNYHQQGNFTAAHDHYNRALAIFEKQLGSQQDETLQTLNILAAMEQDQGNFAKAREIYAKVHTARHSKYGADHVDVGHSLFSLGSISHALGDLNHARTYYEDALRIYTKVYGPEDPYTLDVISDLANLYQDLGDLLTSKKFHSQVLETRKKKLGADHADICYSLLNLGYIAWFEENYTDARTLLEEAIRIAKKRLGAEHPTTLELVAMLAGVLQEQGEYEASETLMLQSLTKLREVYGDEHPTIGACFYKIAWLYHDSGDFPNAREYYQRSVANLEAKLGEGHKYTQLAGTTLGMLEAVDGNDQEAIRRIDLARRNRRSSLVRLLSGMSPAEQLKFVADDDAFHAALTLGLRRDDHQGAVDASASWLINAKGMSQESLAARELITRDLRNPQATETAAQLLEVRRKLAQLAVSIPEPNQKDARKEAIDELTQAELKLSRELAQLVGEPADRGQWVELEEIRSALAADEVLINLAHFKPYDFESERKSIKDRWQPPRYAAWIVPAAGQGEVRIVDLDLAETIDPLVEVIRQAMTHAGKPDGPLFQQGEAAAEAKFREASQQLSEALWQPLAKALPAGTRRLTFSPDSALWLLPWAALPLAEDKYLIEEYSLRFVISGRELVAPDSLVASNPPLLFADPAFDLGPEKIRAAVKAIFRDIVFGENTQRGLVSQTTLGRVLPLPGTLLEAEAISPSVERITGKPPVKYLGQYALESVVKRVRSPEVLVLSTHGFFLPDQYVSQSTGLAANTRSSSLLTVEGKPIENPLLRCGLLLAGCNSPSSGIDDGILTGMEIVGLDLRGTDLVVLSACETGVGQVQTGEGVAGLRQAFQLAGAKGVVSTLWQVPDRDSAIIMRDFFENLANDETRPDALRQAQLQRIESRRHRYGAAHPFFWAAWTLTGK